MPTVPAAGYPYQAFPSTRVPETVPSDYQNIPAATPQAFGAQVGAATERLGSVPSMFDSLGVEVPCPT
jgi:hypothetical protein